MEFTEMKEIAERVGCDWKDIKLPDSQFLQQFAAAIEARTREECAKMCIEEGNKAWQLKGTKDWTYYLEGMSDGADECAAVIRAMP